MMLMKTNTTPRFSFDPALLGYYEKEGWRAYYDRRWLRAFWLLLRLNREQFGMSWGAALLAALDTVRAARAFAPLDNDLPATRSLLERFFARARRTQSLPSDASTLAERELDYWIVHREIAMQRIDAPSDADIEPLVASLTALHVAIFGGSEATMRRSARLRALAATAVDRITGKRSTDIAADWYTVERLLQEAYLAVLTAQR